LPETNNCDILVAAGLITLGAGVLVVDAVLGVIMMRPSLNLNSLLTSGVGFVKYSLIAYSYLV
jgi:hypothetical protein